MVLKLAISTSWCLCVKSQIGFQTKGAQSKVNVDAIDVYFNLTLAATHEHEKCHGEVLERRIPFHVNLDWGFNNSCICCLQCLHINMLVLLLFSNFFKLNRFRCVTIHGLCKIIDLWTIQFLAAFFHACRHSGHHLVAYKKEILCLMSFYHHYVIQYQLIVHMSLCQWIYLSILTKSI